MSALLHISDTHFGTEQAPVVAALEGLVRDTQPAVVVLSGDITQRATRPQFKVARAFMDRLHVPWVAMPGNHDIPLYQLGARVLTPYGRYIEAFGAELAPEFASQEWLVLTVNTTRRYRHEDGEVSEAQIAHVAERLASATPKQMRVVVTHQPVLVTRPEDRSNRLHGADEALRRWAAAGADLVLGGHIHLPFVRPAHEADAQVPRALWAVQAGTAVSSRVRGGQANSVNLLHPGSTPGARNCTVERWDFAAVEGRFVRGKVQALALADG